jgi:EAL domain-containing protein (putative c-di-GMP-specific phosphodiesterase class I)
VHSACRQAAAWNAPGREERLVVSLALCSAQYRGAQAQREVEAALADSGLDPACLELVLTESLLQQHDEAALAMLGRWAARGIRLCLDDFGSGYSNLAYIRRLRVHKLRLDLSGFADLEADAEQRAIVQAMLEGAQHLGLETAAKGVGDQAMADRLREMGCGQALGHLLPAREFERWLADRLAESSEPVTTQAS